MSEDNPHLLIVDQGQSLPPGVAALVNSGQCRVSTVHTFDKATAWPLLRDVDALLVTGRTGTGAGAINGEALADVLRSAARRHLTTLVVGSPDSLDPSDGALMQVIPASTSRDELWGRVSTAARYRELITRTLEELDNIEQVGNQIDQHLAEVDHEMRLASRLQRDFLPKQLPKLAGVQFATLFRPASWVSGW